CTDVISIAHLFLPLFDPDLAAFISEVVITTMSRDVLSFDGVVTTDDLTMQAITDHVDIVDAALKSVQARSDLLLVAHEYDNVETVFDRLKEAVQDGDLSEERIDESVKRIQALKKKYDIADDE